MVKLKGRRESQDKTYDAVSEDDESKLTPKKSPKKSSTPTKKDKKETST